MSQPDVSHLATRLVEWHGAHQRPLPWRNAPAGQRDAYQVWISEVMLQQTRVETVVDYYQRWLARFPTVTALAGAELQTVLKSWEGLGYYARARNLHRAAQVVVERFGGQLPTKRSDRLSLPGIGEYTVGAILSLAFNQPEPVLDGNVKRVVGAPVGHRPVHRSACRAAHPLAVGAPDGDSRAGRECGRLQRGVDGIGRHGLHAAKPPLPALSCGRQLV